MAPKNPSPKYKRNKDPRKSTKSQVQNTATTPGRPTPLPIRSSSLDSSTTLSLSSQQQVLDIFASAFSATFDDDNLPSKIQTLKGHLYKRDFEAAFSDPDLLAAYAVRWSPTRALAYADILVKLLEGDWRRMGGARGEIISNRDGLEDRRRPAARELDSTESSGSLVHGSKGLSGAALKIACIGAGGGAELMALSATMSHFLPKAEDPAATQSMDVTLIDNGPWLPSFQSLMSFTIRKKKGTASVPSSIDQIEGLDTSPPSPLLSDRLSHKFQQLDILSHDSLAVLSPKLQNCNIVTIAFTLNELFTTSRPKTTLFLLHLTDLLPLGALLLIIDSPGSYATVTYNKTHPKSEGEKGEKKEHARYPMVWLLERVLFVEAARENGQDKWEKVGQGEESKWFRLDERLKYPIELEDMRYQMHVYRRV